LTDVKSFSDGLNHVLHQDPDVILISELLDPETIAAAISAAETGHLVLASLHTSSVLQTVDRIIDVFPMAQQAQIRTQLANTLEGVVAQALVPMKDAQRRSCVQEILVATPAVRAAIRGGKIHQLTGIMAAGSQLGMQTMDKELSLLVKNGIISQVEAQKYLAHQEVIEE
jgi:twitching motility protein PilT